MKKSKQSKQSKGLWRVSEIRDLFVTRGTVPSIEYWRMTGAEYNRHKRFIAGHIATALQLAYNDGRYTLALDPHLTDKQRRANHKIETACARAFNCEMRKVKVVSWELTTGRKWAYH